jgi:hypothetical protein
MALYFESQGAHEAALDPCEAALAASPEDREALQLHERLRESLVPLLSERIGSLEQVPTRRLEPAQTPWHKLDHQAGFLLSQVDGLLTYGELLSVSGMSELDTLRTLLRLIELDLIGAER